MSVNSYQEKHQFNKRCDESTSIRRKYPDRIPIIALKQQNCDLPDIDKNKFLVPKSLTLSQFTFVIRKRIELKPSQTIFVTINNNLLSSTRTVDDIYETDKDKDGFLYVVYSSENTFG
jgi:GABA(A) receptor-associated protein